MDDDEQEDEDKHEDEHEEMSMRTSRRIKMSRAAGGRALVSPFHLRFRLTEACNKLIN